MATGLIRIARVTRTAGMTMRVKSLRRSQSAPGCFMAFSAFMVSSSTGLLLPLSVLFPFAAILRIIANPMIFKVLAHELNGSLHLSLVIVAQGHGGQEGRFQYPDGFRVGNRQRAA